MAEDWFSFMRDPRRRVYPHECCRRCHEFSGLVDYADTGDCDSCFQDSEYEEGCDRGFRGCWKGYLLGNFLDIWS